MDLQTLASRALEGHLQYAERVRHAKSSAGRFESLGKEDESAVSLGRIGQANTVLDFAPDLADAVVAGGSLDDAYRIATERKAALDAEAQALKGSSTQS